MRSLSPWLLAGACMLAVKADAEPPRVVASIAPVHSLVAAVMEGVAEPGLLVPANVSPHDYTLRPSTARLLQQADVVFRVGSAMEGFLDKPLATLGAQARVVNLMDAEGIVKLDLRRGDNWPTHEHADTAHIAGSGLVDAHIWLSPTNAAAILRAIGTALSSGDAANAGTYAANTERALKRLAVSELRWRAQIAPVRARPFAVFHDAYHYLEHHFGLNDIGAIVSDPEHQPSAMHLRALLERIRTTDARCLFSEPQFRPSLVEMMQDSSGVRVASLDPLGAGIDPGADGWFLLMDANIGSLTDCLSGN